MLTSSNIWGYTEILPPKLLVVVAPVHPFPKQRAWSQAILQSKPNAFLTFLLPSPSSLCKLPNTHPSRICKSGEAPFQCKPLGKCVRSIIGSLRCHHGDGNENVKGTILLGNENDNFTLAPRNFCTFLYRTARLTIWNCPIFTFYWQRDHTTTNSCFSPKTWIFLKIQIQEIC